MLYGHSVLKMGDIALISMDCLAFVGSLLFSLRNVIGSQIGGKVYTYAASKSSAINSIY